ncbi:hypothetical protein [Luoshenia tenuis]|uniref:hypothetical protein n=1 Tax=Luoshenia tenuis TaxID=2763654 RepID=UPI003D92D794
MRKAAEAGARRAGDAGKPAKDESEKGESPVIQSEGEAGAKNLLRAQWVVLGHGLWELGQRLSPFFSHKREKEGMPEIPRLRSG